LDHRATASPDSHRFASYMEFPTGTGIVIGVSEYWRREKNRKLTFSR
jgi:hypothetical protein